MHTKVDILSPHHVSAPTGSAPTYGISRLQSPGVDIRRYSPESKFLLFFIHGTAFGTPKILTIGDFRHLTVLLGIL
jgi:hypothetical protein